MNDFPHQWPVESDWSDLLQPVFGQAFFQDLNRYVTDERKTQTIYPAAADVFNAFRLTPFSETRVVILGQDPYHGPGQAHGLSFSVKDGCLLPPSLRNIFKELSIDCRVPIPQSGDLTAWAQQGVLLLNTVLTVRHSEANSHRGQGWEIFTDEVIRLLVRQVANPIVFLLWGKPAEKKSRLITDRHTMLYSAHPSPLSAHRGFFGSRPFSQANAALVKSGRTPIRWETICASSSV